MRKEFKRFWKWYKEEIPEVRSYSGKTEENFEELMKEDFSVKERTGTEKAKIRYRLIWLIESMRYDKSPEKMTKEIIETVLGMIAASNKFTKKGKAARDLYREYLTSGTEGYSTDNRSSSEKAEKDMSEESGKPETYDRKGNCSYEKRDKGYNDNNRREITCYRCEKKGHYSSNCEEKGEMKCYNRGKNRHMARVCRNKNPNGYSTKSRERNLNCIGIRSSEGRRIQEDESSSDENNGKRENYDLKMKVNLFTVKR